MIDRAATRFGIDELASLVQTDASRFRRKTLSFVVHLRVTRCRDFFGNTEVLRQTANVTRRNLNTFVHRTTVRRAINAVVITLRLHLRGWSPMIDRSLQSRYRRFDFLYSASSKFMN